VTFFLPVTVVIYEEMELQTDRIEPNKVPEGEKGHHKAKKLNEYDRE